MMQSPTLTLAADPADAEVMLRSQRQPNLFGIVFDRHARHIFAFVAVRVGPECAEDVTSEVFVTAFRRRASFDLTAGSARPWLYGIAVNKLRAHRDVERRWLRDQSVEPASVPVDEPARVDDRVDASRRVPALARALASLSEAERDALLLYVMCDMSQEQVADTLRIGLGAAKARLSRGRANLRDALAASDHASTREETDHA